jgi:hypothetical protein
MNIYSTVRGAIRNVTLKALDEFTNPLVVYSHANGNEPAGSYVTVSILNVDQTGRHVSSGLVEANGATFEETIKVSYEVMAQLSFVGSQSGEMAYSLYQRINNNPLVFEELARNKLGFMRKSQVRRAPQKRDTTWVEYHNLDVTFSYHVVTKQVVGIIEGVVAQAVYDGVIQPSFTVPENLVITP